MIRGYDDQDRFVARLNQYLSPSEPIRSIERLFGRDKDLVSIERALAMRGRHVFVYGDRGVGKSSLAATAASQYQSADAHYLDVSCAPDATFFSVIINIAQRALGQPQTVETVRSSSKSLNLKFLSASVEKQQSQKDLRSSITSLGDAVQLLREIAETHSQRPVVVIDEFDQIQSTEERNLFAHLLKHLGDKGVNLKFIFTGIGTTLDELLGAHQSAIRQLESIELPRLSWDGRFAILEQAFGAFSIEIGDWKWRIAEMTDGYPYYVHLIAEKILWCVFDSTQTPEKVWERHYREGLNEAISRVSAELKRPYEQAIQTGSLEYEEVLWSTAASESLHNELKSMYNDYTGVMKQIPGREPLEQSSFGYHVRKLTTEKFGQVLLAWKRGWYKYRENMLRGYVRMQAEANGVRLTGSSEAEGIEPKYMRVASQRTGYHHGPTTPRGVRMRGEK